MASGPYSFSSKTRSSTSRSGHRDVEGLAQQVAEEVHRDAPVAQHIGEAVVLLRAPAHPQDVVEEQRVLVAGGEPLQLQIGAVQDDAAQPPGLGVDMESHAFILTARSAVHPPPAYMCDNTLTYFEIR